MKADERRALALRAWEGFHAWAEISGYVDDSDALLGDAEDCAAIAMGEAAQRFARACATLRREINAAAEARPEPPEGYEIAREATLAGEAPRYFATARGFQIGAPYDRSGAGSAIFQSEADAVAFAWAHARGEAP